MRPIVLLVLALAASLEAVAAQTFPGVAPPVPAPQSAPAPQPPIVFSPNIHGPSVAPNLMAPVTPVPSSRPMLRGMRYVRHDGGHRSR